MTYPATDTLFGPIIADLVTIVQTQIDPPPDVVYSYPPDKAPQDNSVTIGLNQFKIVDDTNGKIQITMNFAVVHWFRRVNFATDTIRCLSYVMPYIQAFSAWRNQENDLYRIVQVVQGGIKDLARSVEPRIGLVIAVEVLTEFNIDTSP